MEEFIYNSKEDAEDKEVYKNEISINNNNEEDI